MSGEALTAAQKALRMNLDPAWYGTLAEIGGGQEVARWFFVVGGAAGTVAKSISAYDMTVSDGIYGRSRRYVSRERLEQMLEREYVSLCQSLAAARGETTAFFVFADTVATRSYGRHDDGVGWLGIRFQERPGAEPRQIILHARLLDADTARQQEALGLLGVNLIHAAWSLRGELDGLVAALGQGLSTESVEVDFVHVTGPEPSPDVRRLNVGLVLHKVARAVTFGLDGEPCEPSATLYKRAAFVVREPFDTVLREDRDMLAAAAAQLPGEGERETPVLLAEVCAADPRTGRRAEPGDLLARVAALAGAGLAVLVTDLPEVFRVASYLRRYAAPRVVLVLGTQTFAGLFRDRPFEQLEGGMFEALGRLFKPWVRLALHPDRDPRTGALLRLNALTLPPEYRHLVRHLLDNELICELEPIAAMGPSSDGAARMSQTKVP